MTQDIKSFYKAEDFIESLSNMPKDFYTNIKDEKAFLDRTRILLKYMGNPEKNYKIIHVGGTAGKGSVSHIIQNQIYKNACKVGLYTSPHASTSIERIKVNSAFISPKDYAKNVENTKVALQKMYTETGIIPSYFELQMALALKYFANEKCQYVVLEVGCGGRLDSTNVVDTIASVITNIGIDHTEMLGDTKEKIATEKAGIIKKSVPVYTAEEDENIRQIFINHAINQSSKFSFIETQNYKLTSQFPKLKFDYNGQSFSSKLLGISQIKNIILAISVVKDLGFKVFTDIDITLACRLEIVQNKPIVILDSAHNELKFKNLIGFLDNFPEKKKNFILAISDNKDKKLILKDISKYMDKCYITRFSHKWRRCSMMSELAKIIKKYSPKTEIELFIDNEKALKRAILETKDDEILIITGSFFISGELRENWQSKDYILKHLNTEINTN